MTTTNSGAAFIKLGGRPDIRIWNVDIQTNLSGVMDEIFFNVTARRKAPSSGPIPFALRAGRPPSPQGETATIAALMRASIQIKQLWAFSPWGEGARRADEGAFICHGYGASA